MFFELLILLMSVMRFPSIRPAPSLIPGPTVLQFCSNPAYIALLEDVGVDIVELSGNHLLDYGPADLLYTLDMYDQRGWKYFAGGQGS